jgi:hypothetical protein
MFFMRRLWKFWVLGLVLVGVVWILLFVKPGGEGEVEVQELGFLQYSVEVESRYPLKWPEAGRYFFYQGWDDELNKSRAVGSEAVIRFFSIFDNDKSLQLKLENPNYRATGKKMVIDVRLNQSFIRQLSLAEGGEFVLPLPAEKLQRGENFLHFRPRPHLSGMKGFDYHNRGVWFLVQDICFLNIDGSGRLFLKRQENQRALHQPANSLFKIAVDASETEKVMFRVKPESLRREGGTLAVWLIEGRQHRRQLEQYSLEHHKRAAGTLDLRDHRTQIILEFEFRCPDSRAFLVWQGPTLLNRRAKEKREPTIKPLEEKPHIFLIIIDAARFDLVHQRVGEKEITPHINRFSQISTNYVNFYANAPYTGPSVASMLTGYLPEVHTVRALNRQLPGNIETLPVYLKEVGYRTAAVVGNPVLFKHRLVRDFDSAAAVRPLDQTAGEEKTSFNNLNKARSVIGNLDPRVPHFVYFHFLPPHEPYRPPPPWDRVFMESPPISHGADFDEGFIEKRYRSYLNNAAYADSLVGGVIEAIREKGLLDDSLIIVASDHGEAFGEHGLLGHITSNYREMIHVPFLVKMPQQRRQMSVDISCCHLDLLPSLAALVNIPFNPNWQGSPLLFNDTLAGGEQRLIYCRAVGEGFNMALFNRHHKYHFFFGRDELYDLGTDGAEQDNLSTRDIFLNLYLKQKLFRQLVRNRDLKQRLNIQPRQSNETYPKMIKELKSLGYL